MKYKKIDPEESLEKFKTDLAEYNFILEQQLKKIVIPQQPKKKKIKWNFKKRNPWNCYKFRNRRNNREGT